MARVKQTIKVRRRKYGGNTGYAKCKRCGGDGVVKVRKKK